MPTPTWWRIHFGRSQWNPLIGGLCLESGGWLELESNIHSLKLESAI